MITPDHELAHKYLDNLTGIEIGASAHNPFNLPNCKNVDYTDSVDTVYKQAEIKRCGKTAPVDIVASGDNLPLKDSSVDYVISSHVFEHMPNPIGCLFEWIRVVRDGGLIFIIIPQPDALPADCGRPLTPLDHFLDDHVLGRTMESHPQPEGGGHFHIWSYDSFRDFIDVFFPASLEIIDGEPVDTKVGNGHTHVLRVRKNG